MSRRRRRSRGWQDSKARVRRELLAFHPHCHYCDARLDWWTATLDHRIPRSRGGTHLDVVLACLGCNRAKGSMMPGEFMLAVARGKIRIGGPPERLSRHIHYRPAMAGVAV